MPLSELFNANTTTAQGLAAAYSVLLRGVPTEAGFHYLIETAVSTNYGAGPGVTFNEENIFINLANNLVLGNATAAAEFESLASGRTLQEKIGSLYQVLIPPATQTDDGLLFMTRPSALVFYRGVAAERGIPGDDGAAIVAFASMLQICVAQDIGVGNAVNDLVRAVLDGSHAIPGSGTTFTPIEIADGTEFDFDDGPARASALSAYSEIPPGLSPDMLSNGECAIVGSGGNDFGADWIA